MSNPFSNQTVISLPPAITEMTHLQRSNELSKVLAYVGRSIDDVINDPIARNQVWGYFKLQKQIVRSGEIGELERQWNATL